MAKEYFKVLEPSYIGGKLVQADEIVIIETDVNAGGMTPGDNLQKVNSDGSAIGAEKSARGKQPAADAKADDGKTNALA